MTRKQTKTKAKTAKDGKAEAQNKGGRPSSFDTKFVKQAKKLAALGATDREVADFFGVSEATLHRWKHSSPEFCESLKIGKGPADDRVEQSLFRRATGYSFDAVKIMQNNGLPVVVPYVEHVPPDTVACIFWLKNRRPDRWRDKLDVNHSGEVGITERMEAARRRLKADRDGNQ